MYRRGIPLLPQDVLAYQMGLTVPKKDSYLFSKVRTGSKPSSGWGTQIQKREFNPNTVFPKLGIPLSIEQSFIKGFKDPEDLRSLLIDIQNKDGDALLCFDYGKLWGLPRRGGHVCVFDRIEGDNVYIVDPERSVPKYRQANLEKLYAAMNFHGDDNSTGVWRVLPA